MDNNSPPPSSEPSQPQSANHSGLFFLLFLLLLIVPLALYIFLRRRTLIRTNRNPNAFSSYIPFRSSHSSSSSRGAFSNISSKLGHLSASLTGKAKGYAGPPGGRTALFNRLDPDGAWDDRVGTEAEMFNYPGAGGADREYEEAELGGHGHGHARGQAMPRYGGGGAAETEDVDLDGDTEYHSQAGGLGSQEIDKRYDEEMGRGRPGVSTPGARRSVFTEGV